MLLELNPEILINRKDSQLIVYSIQDEKIYNLKGSSDFIIALLEENKRLSEKAILDKVIDHFESPNLEEVENFLIELRNLKIITLAD